MSGISRRQFHRSAVALLLAGPQAAKPRGPELLVKRSAPPRVIGSGNGFVFKHDGDQTAVERAYARLVAGADPLDALVEGVAICELDPRETSVGFGGLPNADGVVQLDASCMHGRLRRAGSVAGLEGVRTPAAVARQVLQQTDHHLLVGAGAQLFARQLGFQIEADLNTEESRRLWLEWKRRIDPGHWLDPNQRSSAGAAARSAMVREGLLDPRHVFGTIHLAALTASRDVASVTTTSGLAFKIPGRVGDSPILGAGNYCDNAVGSCGSTGRGEANLFGLTSFLVVEELRRGAHPKDAIVTAFRRVKANTIERRLLDPTGHPAFGLDLYAMNTAGEYAGGTLRPGTKEHFAICDENGPRHESLEVLG
jgi:N4-(beta-N-acetylglucosaminyl)-L-asparaginase